MRRTHYSPWIVALLATFIGMSGTEVRQSARAQPPARLEQPVEPDRVPAQCRMFLELPRSSRSEILPWQQRLSLAACRQSIALEPVTDMQGMLAALARLDRAMAPSIAIYRDAVARAPNNELRIMAAYWIGMTYVSTMVRARSLIRGGSGSFGGATYGAQLQGSDALRASLEPLLVSRRDAALAAFDDVARLAEADPAAARANQVLVYVVADARRKASQLR